MEHSMKKRLLYAVYLLILFSLALFACGRSATSLSGEFDLENLILDVFAPQPGEKLVVMVDVPSGVVGDNASAWTLRRQMADDWQEVLEEMSGEYGFEMLPLLKYPATGAHSGPLPESGKMNGKSVYLEEVFANANIILAITEYSATAPLIEATQRYPQLRAASMPTISPAMEETALSANYGEVAQKVQLLTERLNRASGAIVAFSTGERMYFDLRFREAEADDGQLHADESSARVINLPSGEAYIVPYEGEREGDPSRSAGTIPFLCGSGIALLDVEGNRVVNVRGDESCAEGLSEFLSVDDARRNIAEMGLGVNDHAVITGNVLEDEKVQGMHWAFGLSEALGGTVGVDDFKDPGNALHWDIVYPTGGRIEIGSLVLEYEDGSNEEIMKEGQYTVFSKLSSAQKMALSGETLAMVWFFAAALCASVIAWDVENTSGITRGMNIGWAWIAMVFGVFALLVYFFVYRRSERGMTETSRALYGAMYAATGSVTGTMFFMMLSIMSPTVDTASPAVTLILLVGLPYLIGLFLFRSTFMTTRLEGGYWQGLKASIFPEFLSNLFVLSGLLPAILLPSALLPDLFGEADPRTLVLFAFGGVTGAIVAYPFYRWMVRRGYPVWPGNVSKLEDIHPAQQMRVRAVMRMLLLGIFLLVVSFGVTFTQIA
jgi:hypothetical protein